MKKIKVMCSIAICMLVAVLGACALDTDNPNRKSEAENSSESGLSSVLENSGLPPGEAESIEVPVLMYHHLAPEKSTNDIIDPDVFEAHMQALQESGYTSIFVDDLIQYVNMGKALPENPIVITFDDGYYSNYEYAYPVLEKYGIKGTIFVIGSFVGKEKYKDTEYDIIPHFDYIQAREMTDSGIISIQSHTYDMHQSPQYEGEGAVRRNVLQLENESPEQYRLALFGDINKSMAEITEATGETVYALAYPYGAYDAKSEEIIAETGIQATFSINPGKAVLVKHDISSLLHMNRFYISGELTPADLLALIS